MTKRTAAATAAKRCPQGHLSINVQIQLSQEAWEIVHKLKPRDRGRLLEQQIAQNSDLFPWDELERLRKKVERAKEILDE